MITWETEAWEEHLADLLQMFVGEEDVDLVLIDANLAPYKIFKQGDKWVVKNNAGDAKASFGSRASALKYLRALYSQVPGAAKKADKTKWSGKEPEPK